MEINVPYNMSWQEWKIPERIMLLDILRINFVHSLRNKQNCLTLEYGLSEGQTEVFKWVLDPTYPLKFYLLDNNYGRKTLNLFNEFWSWRFGVN
jgi:hypothetical protein